ncbi:mechanosensitive ion channel family protein [Persicirhabdus sediminis]|nr:mechanosensitive ion channel domain-containing protein [Persicirhabdus sediminis]
MKLLAITIRSLLGIICFLMMSADLYAEGNRGERQLHKIAQSTKKLESQLEAQKRSLVQQQSWHGQAEALRDELKNFDQSLRKIATEHNSSERAGELLQDVYHKTQLVDDGDRPFTVAGIQASVQAYRALAFELKDRQLENKLESEKLVQLDVANRYDLSNALARERDALVALSQSTELVIESESELLRLGSEISTLNAELQAFVLPRIFWFRSSEGLSLQTLREAADELASARLYYSSNGSEIAESARVYFTAKNCVMLVLVALAISFAFWASRTLKRSLIRHQAAGRKYRLSVGVINLTRAVLPGCILILVCFLVLNSSLSEELREQLSLFFYQLALLLFLVLPVSAICGRQRFAVQVLGLNPEVAGWFRALVFDASLLYALLMVLPNTFAIAPTSWKAVPFLADASYRLSLVVLLLIYCRRNRQLAQYVKSTQGAQSFVWKNWSVIVGLAVSLLIVTLVVGLLGYQFAGDILFHAIVTTVFLGFIMYTLYKPIQSAANKLAAKHAVAWDESIRETAELNYDDAAVNIYIENQPQYLKDTVQRTRTLINAIFLIVAVVLAEMVWNTDGRLYYALGQIHLGSFENLTVANVLVSMILLVMSFAVLRSLPAAFELFVFPRFNLDAGMRYTVVSITRYLLIAGLIFYILSLLQVDLSKVGWLVAALGVGLGFGLQEIVTNFVAGIILLVERPVRVGDIITIGDTSGTVSQINIRATTITDWDRLENVIPNKDLITQKVTNWSLNDHHTRIIIPIGVAYGTDPAVVKNLLLEIGNSHPEVLENPGPQALFRNHGDSSLDFELRVFIQNIILRNAVLDELTTSINKALCDAEIEIPFPQRDLHIRSSDVDLSFSSREGK